LSTGTLGVPSLFLSETDEQNGQEESSLRNVNRGDSRCTILTETTGLSLALSIFPQVYDFEGDEVLKLIEPGLYKKGWRVGNNAK